MSKPDTFSVLSSVHDSNMACILATFDVLNPETSSEVRAEQPLNIMVMSSTLAVESLVASMDARRVHPRNILSMLVVRVVSRPARSMDVMNAQSANMPLRFSFALTPGLMTTALMALRWASHGALLSVWYSRSASVPLGPLEGAMVSVPAPSIVHVQSPLVPLAGLSA